MRPKSKEAQATNTLKVSKRRVINRYGIKAGPEVYKAFLKKELPREGIKIYRDKWAVDKKIILYEGIFRETAEYKRFVITNYYTKQNFYYLVPKVLLDNNNKK